MGHSLDWNQLVEERNAWVAHNFPDPDGKRTPLDSVLGCIEELGELTHHHLKQVQEIRGDTEFHDSEMKDAVGDLTVYLLGVMSHYRVYPVIVTDLLPQTKVDVDQQILRLTKLIGWLADNQGTRQGRKETGRIVTGTVCILAAICHGKDWDYEQIVQDTWDHVKQRDWIKHPGDGVTC